MGMRIDEAGRDDKFGGVDNLGRGTVLDAPDFGDATRLYRDVGAIRWLTRSVYYRSVFDQNVVGHQRPLIYSFAFLILDTANSLFLIPCGAHKTEGACQRSLFASPIWWALFGEGARAFTSVLGSLQPVIQFALEFEAVGKWEVEAAQGRLLDTRNRERRALAYLGCDLLALADELAHRHDVIDEAKAQSLFGADTIAGIEHLQRPAQRNQTGQALSAAS